ncbi:unnamed protein product [Symbiodinium natans]|uniref:Uncharacterized protein n=1 Tax=Symbiodinium natans TaxID=878477 RepID=A0A812RD57_9DINO|nr:unnamed protein product [Symbiodinium natans]
MLLTESEHNDPAWWWWIRLLLVVIYFLVAFWKAYQYSNSVKFWDFVDDFRQSFQRKWLKKQLTSVLPEMSENESDGDARLASGAG